MNEPILHEHERGEISQMFLKDNREKFSDDCIKVLRLLYKGVRLTAKDVNDILNMADGGRRLRDIIRFKKECKKAARRVNDKFVGVEYWLEIPKIQTKSECIEKAETVILQMKKIPDKELVTIFELEDNPPTFKQGQINFND